MVGITQRQNAPLNKSGAVTHSYRQIRNIYSLWISGKEKNMFKSKRSLEGIFRGKSMQRLCVFILLSELIIEEFIQSRFACGRIYQEKQILTGFKLCKYLLRKRFCIYLLIFFLYKLSKYRFASVTFYITYSQFLQKIFEESDLVLKKLISEFYETQIYIIVDISLIL